MWLCEASQSGGSGWLLLATRPVSNQMGDADVSCLGVVGTDGGVWLREVVGRKNDVMVAVPHTWSWVSHRSAG